MFRRPLTLFRTPAVAEAITWTLLISALIARARGGALVLVTVAGPIHGFIFLSYGATAILVAMNNRWGVRPTIVAVASAGIPHATIPARSAPPLGPPRRPAGASRPRTTRATPCGSTASCGGS